MSSETLPYTVEPHPVTGMYSGKVGLWMFLASEVMLFGALFSTYVLLRVGAPEGTWPVGEAETHLSVKIGMINTLVLIISSVTMVMAWAELELKNIGKAKAYLAATLALAVAFFAIKIFFEYIPKMQHYQVVLADGTSMWGHLESEADDHIMFLPDAHHDHDHDHGDAHSHGAQRIERSEITRLKNIVPSFSTYYAIYYTVTGLHGLHVLGGVVVIAYFLLFGIKMWDTDPQRFTNRIECTGLYWHFVDLVWIFVFPIFYLM